MKIKDVRLALGNGGFFCGDQLAGRTGAAKDGLIYRGELTTPRSTSGRILASSLSVGLLFPGATVFKDDLAGTRLH
ncbi:hypothetical protein [Mesorhizobium sp.]|uniref:hypothetical protein n=1 Tax=Mesorhizobium sp. TaxID=1871066 RepID=UPI000FE7A20F|nr:hypothetical protein [Mesorhizobium sp.]RWL09254.1 MAG: hypothetical protein EOR56_23625 [Mesorhizobium sp.]